MRKIVTKADGYKPYDKTYFNTIVLGHDRWNDYGYCTNYMMFYCDNDGLAYDIGNVKIFNKQMEIQKQTYAEINVDQFLGPNTSIGYLSNEFCSLGQDLKYYQTLKEYFPEDYFEILKRLRDIATDEELSKEFVDYKGVKNSLFRNGSAIKAFNEAKEVMAGDIISHNMSFGYWYSPLYSKITTKIEFDFTNRNDCFPYRVNAVVGKNGTGKTLLLNALAEAISGSTYEATKQEGIFLDDRPTFDKVMSVSFSVFDSFRKPEDNKYCSYVYCGIQKNINVKTNNSETVDKAFGKEEEYRPLKSKEIKEIISASLLFIKSQDRYSDWKNIVEELIGADGLKALLLQIVSDNSKLHLSSGQNMLVLSMTLVIANIEKESLLLIDEPETHLHPNAIASFMRMLNMLLDTYDSYAIIATHSPLVLQELPSKNITVLERDNDYLSVRHPVIECFGASISYIIDDTFDVRSNESSYKTILRNALEKMTEEQILDFFDNDLSMNAMIYLKTLSEGGI